MALCAASLAWVAFAGVRDVWPIYALAATSAAFGAFDNPARQALIPTLVPPEHLRMPISLNADHVQTASVVGPSAGGLLIGEAGLGWAYALNAIRFSVVIGAVLAMRGISGRASGGTQKGERRCGLEGLRFVFRNAAHPLDDAAGFLRDVLRVGNRAAADLRAGHPPRRRARLWVLSAAPSVGAILASVVMVRAVDHIERRGPVLLWAIVVYGLATGAVRSVGELRAARSSAWR
jgi:MFS family permease